VLMHKTELKAKILYRSVSYFLLLPCKILRDTVHTRMWLVFQMWCKTWILGTQEQAKNFPTLCIAIRKLFPTSPLVNYYYILLGMVLKIHCLILIFTYNRWASLRWKNSWCCMSCDRAQFY
jgi:hypothetical protein